MGLTRSAITHLAVLIVGIAIGVGGIAVAGTGATTSDSVAKAAASDSRIVKELRRTNALLRRQYTRLGHIDAGIDRVEIASQRTNADLGLTDPITVKSYLKGICTRVGTTPC